MCVCVCASCVCGVMYVCVSCVCVMCVSCMCVCVLYLCIFVVNAGCKAGVYINPLSPVQALSWGLY